MAFQSCCWRFPLRTGCIVINVLDIALGLFLGLFTNMTETGWAIIMTISNGLSIAGVIMEKRFCLLPWMILNILINIMLWIITTMWIYQLMMLHKLILFGQPTKIGDRVLGVFFKLSLLHESISSKQDELEEPAAIEKGEYLEPLLVGIADTLLLIVIVVLHVLLIKVLITLKSFASMNNAKKINTMGFNRF